MYFGSVRFFKNLILLCVILLIAIPAVLAVRFYLSSARMGEQVEQLSAQVEQLNGRMEAVQAAQQSQQQSPQQSAQQGGDSPEPSPGPDAGEGEQAFSPDAPPYQALYPDFYAPQPIGELSKTPGVIYLTFDDGPSQNTDAVLDILAEKGVKATFFINGSTSESSLRRMRDVVDQGHTLAMHSYTHKYADIYSSVEAYLGDMYQLFALIRDTTGQTPTYFRFPGGSINSHNLGLYQELIAEMLRRGFIPCDWNMSAQDATSSPLPRQTIVDNVLSGAAGKDRGIVLMHDGAGQGTTVQALEEIIDSLGAMGFRFERLEPGVAPILLSYRN